MIEFSTEVWVGDVNHESPHRKEKKNLGTELLDLPTLRSQACGGMWQGRQRGVRPREL